MNLFILATDLTESASYHTDRHVLSQIREATQMMCWAVQYSGYRGDDLYKYSHRHENHPCTVWVRQNQANFIWTYLYASALEAEWQYRWKRKRSHACIEVADRALELRGYLPSCSDTMTPHVQVTGIIKADDAVSAYREYYRTQKAHLFRWSRRQKPGWIDSL